MTSARRRIEAALRTWPDRRGWISILLLAAAGLCVMGLIASVGGLVHLAPAPFGSTWLRVALLLFVIPAFGEELLFRALLVPRPDQPFLASRAVLIIALFVAWHPFQALTFGPPWAAMFLDPWFLGAVAVLGATSTAIYRTTGSIWPCIGMHWLVVASWKLIFGGPF